MYRLAWRLRRPARARCPRCLTHAQTPAHITRHAVCLCYAEHLRRGRVVHRMFTSRYSYMCRCATQNIFGEIAWKGDPRVEGLRWTFAQYVDFAPMVGGEGSVY